MMPLLGIAVALALVALAADMLQTLQIALRPDKWKETGWARYFIGEHPGPVAAIAYFVGCALITIVVCVFLLPQAVGAVAAAVLLGIEVVTVRTNRDRGIPYW